MSSELSKQDWVMLALTTPFIAGMTHLALESVCSVQPEVLETRDVSFKVVFDDRVSFPQTISQSTVVKLLGPEYEIVAPRGAAQPSTGARPAAASGGRDCRIDGHGGLLTLRVPEEASPAEIARRLEKLGRVKLVNVHTKK